MSCALKHRSAGLRKRRWWLHTTPCCMSAAPSKSSAAPIRAWHPARTARCPAARLSHARSTLPRASGNPHTCCQTGATAWRCGPTVRVSAAGSTTIPASTSAAGATTCCATNTAVLFTCVLTTTPLNAVVPQRRIPSLRTPPRTHSGATAAALWRTACSLMQHPASSRPPPLCWSAPRTTPSCAPW